MNQLPSSDIAWFNPGRHPAQGVIARSSITEQAIAGGGRNATTAISLAGDSTGDALSKTSNSTGLALSTANDSTGNALQTSYRHTRHALGTAARQKVVTSFGWEDKVDRVVEIYRRAVDQVSAQNGRRDDFLSVPNVCLRDSEAIQCSTTPVGFGN